MSSSASKSSTGWRRTRCEIGLVLECPAPLLFNKNLRNLPKAKAYIGWDSYGLSTYHPEAFYYEGGSAGVMLV